ncbi:hypothetical protein FDP41_001162 [Naegleria fowleri]|uniref:C2 domain-containing protein n=1 Tax=Naegleria fowleri TaxID=5763 RepID=A0A6A5C3X5_NAEFO|nr:uncharacterized protein FDP41_001162 [Naegleria fowleri]KAF0980009.1 hypothetical protein FDP41_001162 [Naegleria fowleri]
MQSSSSEESSKEEIPPSSSSTPPSNPTELTMDNSRNHVENSMTMDSQPVCGSYDGSESSSSTASTSPLASQVLSSVENINNDKQQLIPGTNGMTSNAHSTTSLATTSHSSVLSSITPTHQPRKMNDLVTPLNNLSDSPMSSSLIMPDNTQKTTKTSFKFFLKPKQRSLRHLRAIHVRNIRSNDVVCSFASVYIRKEKDGSDLELLFRTGILEQSVNPSWNFELNVNPKFSEDDENDPTDTESKITDLVVKIYSVKHSLQNQSILHLQETTHPNIDLEEEFICEEHFDFNHLNFVGVTMKDLIITELPINCILLEFVDGVFISEDLDAVLKKHGVGNEKITRKSFRVDQSSHEVSLAELEHAVEKLCGTQLAIQESQLTIEEIQANIKKEIEKRQKIIEITQQIALRKSRIKRLNAVIQQTKESIDKRKNQLEEKKRDLKEKHQQLLESQQDLLEQRLSLSREQAGFLSTQKEELSILEQKFRHRQAMIVQQLSSIYMIGPHPQKQTNDLYINGLTICRGEQPNNDDEAASALGFVAHCVRILSKLFQIPLKYQIYALSSRSFVSEEGQNDQNVLLPLFMLRGSERTKFYKAIILLNLNLQHILKVKGFKRPMKSERKFDVLDNLQFLFKNLQK